MDEQPSFAPDAGFWRRRSTRRGVLAGGAAVAAAGTVAAVFGLAGSGSDDVSTTPADPQGGGGDEANEAAAAIEEELDQPIADPKRRAAHLLRRAGFGGSADQIDEFSRYSREEAADRLLDFTSIDNSALNARVETANFELQDYGNGLGIDMQRWWLMRMAYTARPLEERMTYIWHGLLTTQVSKVGNQRAKLLVTQNELFRSMALPKYDDLLKAISRDPAMLFYLDNVESTKEHPNENYARELMELYSMGVGNYTEQDVRESARAFAGWRVTQQERRAQPPSGNLTQEERQKILRAASVAWQPAFYIAPRLADTGSKTFLGKTGNFTGDDVIDIIMQQPATGRYICSRLFTEFANYNPPPETIDSLVRTWDSSGHQVRDVVRAILVSDEFYSERSYRGLVRSPVEFVVGLVRALEIETDFRAVVNRQSGYGTMDQVLFEPPSVAGWPGGSTWLSSSTFFARVNFLDSMLFGIAPTGGGGPGQQQQRQPAGRPQAPRPIAIPALQSATTAAQAIDLATERLIDGNISAAAKETMLAHVSGISNAAERAATVAYLVAASPEYQLV